MVANKEDIFKGESVTKKEVSDAQERYKSLMEDDKEDDDAPLPE